MRLLHPSRQTTRVALVAAVALAAVSLGAAPAMADRDDNRRHHRGYDRGHQSYNHHANHGHYNHGHGQVVVTQHHYRPRPHPVVVAPACRYIPAHYETRTHQVCVQPAHTHRVWHEPQFGFRYDSRGHHVRVVISPGHWDTVTTPARYETRTHRVYVPATWACADGCTGHHH